MQITVSISINFLHLSFWFEFRTAIGPIFPVFINIIIFLFDFSPSIVWLEEIKDDNLFSFFEPSIFTYMLVAIETHISLILSFPNTL